MVVFHRAFFQEAALCEPLFVHGNDGGGSKVGLGLLIIAGWLLFEGDLDF